MVGPVHDLTDWDVTVRMIRHTPAGDEHRAFALRVPAVDADHAVRAGYDVAHGVNVSSCREWKLPLLDNVVAVPATSPGERTHASLAGEAYLLGKAVDRLTAGRTRALQLLDQWRGEGFDDAHHEHCYRTHPGCLVRAVRAALHQPGQE